MNEIKKSLEQIKIPKNLHQVAYARLNESKSKKNKNWMISIIAMLFLVICTTPVVFSDYFSISDFFDSKDNKLSSIDDSKIIAESEMFSISLKQFIDYKENILLVHELNNSHDDLSNMDLVNQLIENKLLLYEAKSNGVVATAKEVNDYATETKRAVLESNDNTLLQINEELAKRLNVSIEEYFTHPTTLEQYESLIITNKFITKLYSEGVLNDGYTIERYKTDLREKHKKEIKINLNNLK